MVFDDVTKVSNQLREPEYPSNDPDIEPVYDPLYEPVYDPLYEPVILPFNMVVLPDKIADDVTSKISKLPVFT